MYLVGKNFIKVSETWIKTWIDVFAAVLTFYICLRLVYKQPDKAKKVSAFQQFSNYVIMESCVNLLMTF